MKISYAELKLTVWALQFAKQQAKWVQNSKVVLTLRRESCKVKCEICEVKSQSYKVFACDA